jgi:hypothetical protein
VRRDLAADVPPASSTTTHKPVRLVGHMGHQPTYRAEPNDRNATNPLKRAAHRNHRPV